jgi:hypothetical protein
VAASFASTRIAIAGIATAVMYAGHRRATSPEGRLGAGIGTHRRAVPIIAMLSMRAVRVAAAALVIMVRRT